jgi:hypothetical protein
LSIAKLSVAIDRQSKHQKAAFKAAFLLGAANLQIAIALAPWIH